jgi:hypothetical protein
MMRLLRGDLHHHTHHSDGAESVAEAARRCRAQGYDFLAVTDHDTGAAWREAAQVSGLTLMPGVEVTTFHGHALALGTWGPVEWRDLGRGDAPRLFGRIRAAGGLAAVAHPFFVGGSVCAGCAWDFADWEGADAVEVWHGPDPQERPHNRAALRRWEELLTAGERPVPLGVRDWHGGGEAGEEWASTWVYAAGAALSDVVEALRRGRVFVSVGPRLVLTGEGDLLPGDEAAGEVALRLAYLGGWPGTVELRLVGPQGPWAGRRVRGRGLLEHRWCAAPGEWCRGEVAVGERLLAFTHPVFGPA